MKYLADHGLPLVQLKERRREMVVALQNRIGPITDGELRQIAAIQQTISAFEEMSLQISMPSCSIGRREGRRPIPNVLQEAIRDAWRTSNVGSCCGSKY